VTQTKPTLSLKLAPQELASLRDLAKQHGCILRSGRRAGEGSIQQLMKLLADPDASTGFVFRPLYYSVIAAGKDGHYHRVDTCHEPIPDIETIESED